MIIVRMVGALLEDLLLGLAPSLKIAIRRRLAQRLRGGITTHAWARDSEWYLSLCE